MKDYKSMILKKKIMQKETFALFNKITVEANCCLLRQGEQLNELYLLLKGRVKAYSTTANGVTHLSGVSYPVTVLGEVEFLNRLPINNDVYTLERCELLAVSVYQYYDDLINDLYFVRFLAQQISLKLYKDNYNAVISINYPVENRIAAYFIACHDQGMIKENFVRVATLIGCSYRQLQRVLNCLCQKGYIYKTGRGEYRIIDFDYLETLGQDIYRL